MAMIHHTCLLVLQIHILIREGLGEGTQASQTDNQV